MQVNDNLSDLFFNFQHDNYDEKRREFAMTKENTQYTEEQQLELEDALLKDAEFFCEILGGITGDECSAKELVSDFKNRL